MRTAILTIKLPDGRELLRRERDIAGNKYIAGIVGVRSYVEGLSVGEDTAAIAANVILFHAASFGQEVEISQR